MIRLFNYISFLSFSILPPFYSFGQDSDLTIAERLAELKAMSSVHEGQIAQLLAEPAIRRTNFDLPVSQPRTIYTTPPAPPPPPSIPEKANIPVLETEEIREVQPVNNITSDSDVVIDQNTTSTENKELDAAYAKLY